MGKIFPLSLKSSCYSKTIELIEKSFEYKKPNSFEIDFAPLIDKSNHHNCFIMVDENENVLAHIGVKERVIHIDGESFPISFIGGIAVEEKRRGEGIFQTLFQDVLAEKRSDNALLFLWSDLESLYNKFGFYLAGSQIEIEKSRRPSPFITTTYHSLPQLKKEEIQNIFNNSFAKRYAVPFRPNEEWTLLEKITSADLFIREEDGRISDYYFQNKGQDLPEIIYEYGSKNKLEDLVDEISHYGKVWIGESLNTNDLVNLQFQSFLCPGNLKLFSNFIHKFTQGKFEVRNINLMKQEVYFDFNDETLVLETAEFLKGVFGPGKFEELDVPSLFISGIDSV